MVECRFTNLYLYIYYNNFLIYSLWGDKCILVDGFNHRFEGDFRGESVAVVNDGVIIRTVPAVHWNNNKQQSARIRLQSDQGAQFAPAFVYCIISATNAIIT